MVGTRFNTLYGDFVLQFYSLVCVSQTKLRLNYFLTPWNLKNISKLSHEAMSNVFFLYFSVQSVHQPVVRK